MTGFKISSDYSPSGDQPAAIQALVEGLNHGRNAQTLLGVTGSGKTFTIAQVIQQVQRPTQASGYDSKVILDAPR